MEQIATAQIIRRFRDLDMPVETVRSVLVARTVLERNALIAQHLRQMEGELERVHAAVASLRELLEHPSAERPRPIEHRHVPALRVAAVRAQILTADLGVWIAGAFGELYAVLNAQGISRTGPAGGIYANALFEDESGEALVYLPVSASVRAGGRVAMMELPAIDLAIVEHAGPEPGIDLAYGALAEYVARHAIAVAGPIRELYPVGSHETTDTSQWRTEIGWPIFATQTSSRPL